MGQLLLSLSSPSLLSGGIPPDSAANDDAGDIPSPETMCFDEMCSESPECL